MALVVDVVVGRVVALVARLSQVVGRAAVVLIAQVFGRVPVVLVAGQVAVVMLA